MVLMVHWSDVGLAAALPPGNWPTTSPVARTFVASFVYVCTPGGPQSVAVGMSKEVSEIDNADALLTFVDEPGTFF